METRATYQAFQDTASRAIIDGGTAAVAAGMPGPTDRPAGDGVAILATRADMIDVTAQVRASLQAPGSTDDDRICVEAVFDAVGISITGGTVARQMKDASVVGPPFSGAMTQHLVGGVFPTSGEAAELPDPTCTLPPQQWPRGRGVDTE